MKFQQHKASPVYYNNGTVCGRIYVVRQPIHADIRSYLGAYMYDEIDTKIVQNMSSIIAISQILHAVI